jgi:hypothetical protein
MSSSSILRVYNDNVTQENPNRISVQSALSMESCNNQGRGYDMRIPTGQ